jgi:hypothetical protein
MGTSIPIAETLDALSWRERICAADVGLIRERRPARRFEHLMLHFFEFRQPRSRCRPTQACQ